VAVPRGTLRTGATKIAPWSRAPHRVSGGDGGLHVMLDAPARNALLDAHGDVGQGERCGRFDQ